MLINMDFSGKVVLITGASSEIGKATAISFARCGASMILTGRQKEKLEPLAKTCEQFHNVEPLIVTADLTDESDVAQIVDRTIKHFLTLDILVNNATMLLLESYKATSLDMFDKVFRINVRAIFHLTQLFLPYLQRSKGAIVNVSSVSGMRAYGALAYTMSMSAIDQFTNSLALEMAGYKVRVNSVNTGLIESQTYIKAGMSLEAYAKLIERSKVTNTLGRPGKPEEVASAIVFLASSNASFITGINLYVDGGRCLKF